MDYLEIAREYLRRETERRPAPDRDCYRAAAAPDPCRAVEDVLKGRAVLVVLDGTGDRCWIVADAEDASALGDVGDDAVITRGEVRILAAIEDADVRAEVMEFKRNLRGVLGERP